jgi:DNA-binding beta-propeller fold protein YncE
LGRAVDGREYVFSANGGTGDVSVIDLARALEGDPLAEIARLPLQVGPWGITATPDRRHVIVANGGSQRERRSGNVLSIIDVERASTGSADAEVARVLVGTDDPEEQTHPLIPSVTPDGREVVVPNIRTDNVSIVDLAMALSGNPDAEVARIPLTRADGRTARPKGSAITSDGRFAVISAGPRSEPLSLEPGHVYVVDLRSRLVVATVTGVGNDPYGVALVYR